MPYIASHCSQLVKVLDDCEQLAHEKFPRAEHKVGKTELRIIALVHRNDDPSFVSGEDEGDPRSFTAAVVLVEGFTPYGEIKGINQALLTAGGASAYGAAKWLRKMLRERTAN